MAAWRKLRKAMDGCVLGGSRSMKITAVGGLDPLPLDLPLLVLGVFSYQFFWVKIFDIFSNTNYDY